MIAVRGRKIGWYLKEPTVRTSQIGRKQVMLAVLEKTASEPAWCRQLCPIPMRSAQFGLRSFPPPSPNFAEARVRWFPNKADTKLRFQIQERSL